MYIKVKVITQVVFYQMLYLVLLLLSSSLLLLLHKGILLESNNILLVSVFYTFYTIRLHRMYNCNLQTYNKLQM